MFRESCGFVSHDLVLSVVRFCSIYPYRYLITRRGTNSEDDVEHDIFICFVSRTELNLAIMNISVAKQGN